MNQKLSLPISEFLMLSMFKKAVSVSGAEGHNLEQWPLKRSLTGIKRFF
uniref:Uncharacterized protein n=1 Tax=Aegilops tauschii subsp. strangulata TaxID=200361 RepID=A0A453JIK1_AEGTS